MSEKWRSLSNRSETRAAAGDYSMGTSAPPRSQVHPDYPPRARIEWVIAGARVALALGNLLAFSLDPTPASQYTLWTLTVLVVYLVQSGATLALVWKPIEFSRTWGLAGHVF